MLAAFFGQLESSADQDGQSRIFRKVWVGRGEPAIPESRAAIGHNLPAVEAVFTQARGLGASGIVGERGHKWRIARNRARCV